MNAAECKELLYRLVYPAHPNEWEVDELVQRLAGLPGDRQKLLFDQVQAIWPVSHALCLAFLEQGSRHIAVPTHLIADWIRALLAAYESGGLAAARGLLVDGGSSFLASLEPTGVTMLEQISPWLLLFLHGLAGRPMELAAAAVAATDGETLFLPAYLDIFDDHEDNKTLYKFLTALHWALNHQGMHQAVPGAEAVAATCSLFNGRPVVGGEPGMAAFLARFPVPLLAADLFFIGACRQAMRWIAAELPGLAGQWVELLPRLKKRLPTEPDEVGRAVVRSMTSALAGPSDASPFPLYYDATTDTPLGSVADDLVDCYRRIGVDTMVYRRPKLLDLLGRIDFAALAARRERRRSEVRESFVMQVARLLSRQRPVAQEPAAAAGETSDGVRIMLVDRKEPSPGRLALQIDNESCELPEELQTLATEISLDLGGVPESYLAAAVGAAGTTPSGETPQAAEIHEQQLGGRQVDEWDYRRRGYRKNWCTLYEKEVEPVQSTFVAATRERYRGVLTRLRRQFEMMRVNECFVGRQREGDDLDLDAVVDARADRRAGTAATDNLFVRLLRNERDLATLFLVDMSNSTQGWVGRVIKEALVLICEAMEVAGDRYGIYGFSGMRRSRCELFPIKRLDEPWRDAVVRRIGSIAPSEYTRIGPAIRFGIQELRRCDARSRLLITITDGKPEDYDDYKGDYAIEDTRKALLEARGSGLHAFGVAVDRQAREYLPRIFGRSNYLVVDHVEQLPMRMVEMYRQLTS